MAYANTIAYYWMVQDGRYIRPDMVEGEKDWCWSDDADRLEVSPSSEPSLVCGPLFRTFFLAISNPWTGHDRKSFINGEFAFVEIVFLNVEYDLFEVELLHNLLKTVRLEDFKGKTLQLDVLCKVTHNFLVEIEIDASNNLINVWWIVNDD